MILRIETQGNQGTIGSSPIHALLRISCVVRKLCENSSRLFQPFVQREHYSSVLSAGEYLIGDKTNVSDEPYLDKAQESLAGAESELANRRYQNAANRAYYACYQAAVAALHREGIQAPGKRWGHDTVRAQFAGELIRRRKMYPSELRDTFERLGELRQRADYAAMPVLELPAARAVRRAKEFVGAVRSTLDKRQ